MAPPRAILLLTLTVIGSVVSDKFESPTRFLVAAGQTQTVYVWPSKEIELHCRPQNRTGCVWKRDSNIFSQGDCQISTSNRGRFTCHHGGENIGSVTLTDAQQQSYTVTLERGYYRRRTQETRYIRPSESAVRKSHFLCQVDSKLIERSQACDGVKQCHDGEDEEDCVRVCGIPQVAPNSYVTPTDKNTYDDDSQVIYRCHPGFYFLDGVNQTTRECRVNRWSAGPPTCYQNIALGRNVTTSGVQIVPGAEAWRTATDGNYDTWYALRPTFSSQSLTVHLDGPTSVQRVLIHSFDKPYKVLLVPENGSDNGRECTPCHDVATTPTQTLHGLRYCNCPKVSANGVSIQSQGGSYGALGISEIVVYPRQTEVEGENCLLLHPPAHGRYNTLPDKRTAQLSCDPGYLPDRDGQFACSATPEDRPLCVPIHCSPPPQIPSAQVVGQNGTVWSSVARFGCIAGYTLFPAGQETESVCDALGLWSLGHVTCLQETDVRVVVSRQADRHRAAMDELQAQLAALGRQQLRQLNNSVQQLRLELNQTVQQLRVELNESRLEQEQLKEQLAQQLGIDTGSAGGSQLADGFAPPSVAAADTLHSRQLAEKAQQDGAAGTTLVNGTSTQNTVSVAEEGTSAQDVIAMTEERYAADDTISSTKEGASDVAVTSATEMERPANSDAVAEEQPPLAANTGLVPEVAS